MGALAHSIFVENAESGDMYFHLWARWIFRVYNEILISTENWVGDFGGNPVHEQQFTSTYRHWLIAYVPLCILKIVFRNNVIEWKFESLYCLAAQLVLRRPKIAKCQLNIRYIYYCSYCKTVNTRKMNCVFLSCHHLSFGDLCVHNGQPFTIHLCTSKL